MQASLAHAHTHIYRYIRTRTRTQTSELTKPTFSTLAQAQKGPPQEGAWKFPRYICIHMIHQIIEPL